MNVQKTDFASKQKRAQPRSHKVLGSFFSGFHTMPGILGSDRGLKVSQAKEFEVPIGIDSETTNLKLPSHRPLTEEKFESKAFEDLSRDPIQTSTSVFSASRHTNESRIQFQNDLKDSNTSTSVEFKKLLEPFQKCRTKQNEDSASNFFEDSDQVTGKLSRLTEEPSKSTAQEQNVTTFEKISGSITGNIQQNISFRGKPFQQYNIFSLPAPKNQRSIEEVFNPKCSVRTASNQHETSMSSLANKRKTPANSLQKSPKTSASFKTTHSDSGTFILGVTEGRGNARGEVGIAAMDPKRPHLILCQISDSRRYVHSLTKMNVFHFVEVIVPNTLVDCAAPNKLYCDIRSTFPNVTMTSVQRRHFNETLGIDLIKQYCSLESSSVMVLVRDKFYALSAAAALIKYVEFTQNVRLAPQSLRIEYQGMEDTVIIDLETANLLELMTCLNHPEVNLKHSLFGVINHCHTKGGVRLLRANILQPPCSLTKIETRLDCVAELVANPLILCALEAAVTNFTNVENLLNLCMHAPRQEGVRVAEYQLKYTLLLKTVLEMLPVLRASLQNAKSPYFCKVRENLQDPRYSLILDRILEIVLENAKTVRGSVAAHLHGCFAVKPGINSLLDIAKKTYCEIVQEISDHVSLLRERHQMPLRIAFSSNKGFYIQYTLPPEQRSLKESDLPKEYILVHKSKSRVSFYTAELVALDQRSRHVLNEIKLMTNVILFQLLTDIRQHVGCLFNLCEDIAELDILISFAHVGSGTNFVKPKFGEELYLKASRHPILDVIHDGQVIPNDVHAKPGKNFFILTGPNQSGKSVYIRQIALLQIMAQVGCFVPAEEATFRLTDRIFSRIGFDDSIENNASTLIVEMRDMEFLKQNLTGRSLVIIDELCRGTSVDEGTSLAFAICEELLDSSAFVFFTTHYLFLTKLEEIYFNVSNFHFETVVTKTASGKPSIQFTHLRKPGVTRADMYGLQVAEMTSFPKDVLSKAKEIAIKLSKERKPTRTVLGLVSQYELSLQLREELIKLQSGFDSLEMKAVIGRYKKLYSELVNGQRGGGNGLELEAIPPNQAVGALPLEGTGKGCPVAVDLIVRDSGQLACKLVKNIKKKYRKLGERRAKKNPNQTVWIRECEGGHAVSFIPVPRGQGAESLHSMCKFSKSALIICLPSGKIVEPFGVS